MIYAEQRVHYLHEVATPGSEAVLGVQWLQTLGPVTFDFDKLKLMFDKDGKKVELRGTKEGTVSLKVLTGKSFCKLLKKHKVGNIAQLFTITLIVHQPVSDPSISSLIIEFSDIFIEPKGLPPNRSHDHHIPLIPNNQPVNIRPYKCAYYKKEEIEKVVKESNSPFASTVLLVKKMVLGECALTIEGFQFP